MGLHVIEEKKMLDQTVLILPLFVFDCKITFKLKIEIKMRNRVKNGAKA